ncbi:MAG TPA: cytochrome c [Hanamia sp.]
MKKITVVSFLFIPLFLLLMGMKNDFSTKNFSNQPGLQKSIIAGKIVFKKYCISCHQADGGGVPNMNPPLIQTSFVLGNKDTLINIVLKGLKNVTIDDETYNNPMPALGTVLKDQQIADVLTYVRNSFGNKTSGITAQEVKTVRDSSK